MTMTTTIRMHGDGYTEPRPAINIKLTHLTRNDYLADDLFVSLVDEIEGGAGFTAVWVNEHVTDEEFEYWYGVACGQGFAALELAAWDAFGEHVRVHQEGRSGGWAEFEGLLHPLEWTPEDIDKWAGLATIAAELCADIPRSTLWLIGTNVYETELRAFSAAEEAYNDILADSAARLFAVAS